MRIMVVDDQTATVKMLNQHLQPLGHYVIRAEDASQALLRLAESLGAFDLLLVDVKHSHWNGWALLQEIQKQGYGVPTILIDSEWVETQAAELVAFCCLLKQPLNMAELITNVPNFCQEQCALAPACLLRQFLDQHAEALNSKTLPS